MAEAILELANAHLNQTNVELDRCYCSLLTFDALRRELEGKAAFIADGEGGLEFVYAGIRFTYGEINPYVGGFILTNQERTEKMIGMQLPAVQRG